MRVQKTTRESHSRAIRGHDVIMFNLSSVVWTERISQCVQWVAAFAGGTSQATSHVGDETDQVFSTSS